MGDIKPFPMGVEAAREAVQTFVPDFCKAYIPTAEPIADAVRVLELGTWEVPHAVGERTAYVDRRGIRIGRPNVPPSMGDTFVPLSRAAALELAHQLLDLIAGEEGETWE